MANETVTYSLEAVLTRIEGKIDSLQRDVNQKFDKIDERLTKVEIGQSEIRGDIKALDERLTTEIKGLRDFQKINYSCSRIIIILGV
ncbi:DUF4164 domain-containing protein [Microcystis sp. LE18-22.4A]|uniref:DUF4164 domain-containing protein n=1 Tax=Microcystis sp. LE18-22.4A TaxID=3016432 RepID=UPI0033903862